MIIKKIVFILIISSFSCLYSFSENNGVVIDNIKEEEVVRNYPLGFKDMKYTDGMYSLIDLYYGYQNNNKHHLGFDFLSLIGSGRGSNFDERLLLGISISQMNMCDEYLSLSFLQLSTGLRLLSIENQDMDLNIYDFLQIKVKPISFGHNFDNEDFEYTPEISIGNEFVIGFLITSIDYRLFILDFDRSHFEARVGLRVGYFGHYITR